MTQVMTPHPAAAVALERRRRRAAFTLTELMVAIALVVLLMIGVQTVFKSAVSTVSAGQALNDLTRLERGIVTTVQRDSRRMVPVASQPYLIISSRRSAAVALHRKDKDTPGAASQHRIDTLAFFAKSYSDPFHRMTGDSAYALVSEGISTDAWIWYGHVMLPNNAKTDYYAPPPDGPLATAGNDNNGYAGQWTLGRVAVLLQGGSTPLAIPVGAFRYDAQSSSLTSEASRIPGVEMLARFAADPWPKRDADMSAPAAGMVPVIAQGCTDFAVEFAGDFENQDPLGDPTQPDGVVDYDVDASGTRSIRWYGLSRPVKAGTGTLLPFERSFSADDHYVCIWGSNVGGGYPSLVRLTVTLVDPGGRLETPRTFTHVIRVTGSQLGN